MGNASALDGVPEVLEPLKSDTCAKELPGTVATAASLDPPVPLRTPEDYERAHSHRWRRVVRQGVRAFRARDEEKFQSLVLKGIPSECRWLVWKAALNSEGRAAGKYTELLESAPKVLSDTPYMRLISVDCPRTFRDDACFDMERRRLLERVLRAYACFNPEVGYCQGMNFIAGTLLIVSEGADEEAFEVFLTLMEDHGLNGFYKERFPLLERYIRAFVQLLEHTCPELAEHLARVGVQPGDYLHNWFLTLFVNKMAMSSAMIIWDSIVCKGLDVILPVTVALLQVLRDVLSAMPFEDILSFFRGLEDDRPSEADALETGRLLMRKSSHLQVPEDVRCILQEEQ